jgi:hypothetical protein
MKRPSVPAKVAEPAAPYTATPPAAPAPAVPAPARPEADFQPRYADDATFRKAMDKVFRERKDLLRRLAQ